MADLFALTQRDVERLRRILEESETGALSNRPDDTLDTRFLQQGHVITGYLDTAIPGIANLNSNPNVGTLSVYTFTSSGQTDTLRNEQVYHFATVAATTDRWTQAKRDETTGKYIIDFQPCSTT